MSQPDPAEIVVGHLTRVDVADLTVMADAFVKAGGIAVASRVLEIVGKLSGFAPGAPVEMQPAPPGAEAKPGE